MKYKIGDKVLFTYYEYKCGEGEIVQIKKQLFVTLYRIIFNNSYGGAIVFWVREGDILKLITKIP
jgi:hypothetical protein